MWFSNDWILSVKIVFLQIVCLYYRHFVCNLLCNSHLHTHLIKRISYWFYLFLLFLFFLNPGIFCIIPGKIQVTSWLSPRQAFLRLYQSFLPASCSSFLLFFLLLLSQPWSYANIPYRDSALESSLILTRSLTPNCIWYHREASQRENVIFHEE